MNHHVRRRLPVLSLVLACGLLGACGRSSAPATGTPPGGEPPPGGDGANVFLAIVPPGSNGNSAGAVGGPLPGQPQLAYPDNYRDQLDLYGDLAYAQSPLRSDRCAPPANVGAHQKSSDQACNYFKKANLELPDSEAVSSLTLTAPNGKPVTIRRDGWGVPYVDGADRQAAQFGLGYAAAADRLWLFDVLRAAGRGRASEKLGPSPTTYDLDLEFGSASAYGEEEISGIVDNAVAKLGPLGPLFLQDTQSFVAGMNAYIDYLQTPAGLSKVPLEYATLGLRLGGEPLFPPADFTVNDIVANAVLIQSALGLGGGGEARNLQLLQAIDPSITGGTTRLPEAACKLWRDLRHANAPDTPVTASGTFATQSPPSVDESCPQTLPPGTAIWDVGSFVGHSLQSHGPGLPTLPLPLAVPEAPLGVDGLRGLGRLNLLPPAPADRLAELAQPPLRPGISHLVAQQASADPGMSLKQLLNRHGLPMTSSNWIAAAGSQTESGHPILVAGPQTSYFMPQLLWEAAVVSRGGTPYELAARGISTVNLPYIVIGRGLDFAWSPTSAGSDFTDLRVSKLCNTSGAPASRADADGDGYPDSDGYLYKGRCVRLYKRLDTWTANLTVASLALGGPQNPETVRRYVLRTHYGPVVGTATVQGEPVVVSSQRSTFLADVDTAAPFALLTTTGMAMDHTRFKKLFNSMTATFNWLYADSKDIAYIQSGLYPQRAAGVHPELPNWGDGNYEWVADQNLPDDFFSRYGGERPYPSRARPTAMDDQGYYEWPGFLPLSAHIQDLNPPQGYLANWNNSGAAGWWAADANGTYGPTHRVSMLSDRLAAFKASGRKHTLATMVEVMADAAYTDHRGQTLLPLLIELARSGPLSDDQRAVLALMQDWLDQGSRQWIDGGQGLGAYRRDRDADGVYDHRAAVVFMDAWYLRLMQTLTPQLETLSTKAGVLTGRFDAPRAQGSAFQEGWYQHMRRLLQTALDTPGHARYRALQCAGSEDPSQCRTAVLSALDQALTDLGGLANRPAWDGTQLVYPKAADCGVVEDCDAVEHTSFAYQPVPAIHWINRPTFQQAAEIVRDRNGR